MGIIWFLIIQIQKFISSSDDLYPGLLADIHIQQCIHGKGGEELRGKSVEGEIDIDLNILLRSF